MLLPLMVKADGPTWEYTGKYGYLKYGVNENRIKIISCDINAIGRIDIPESIDNLPVVEISGDGDRFAFAYCKSITEVTIPNSVTRIIDNAFFGCISLTSVKIPNGVKSIGYRAFGFYTNDSYNVVKLPGFKIYCYKNTAGEQYAIDNGFDYELLDAPVSTYT